jgi:hypothetical protein
MKMLRMKLPEKEKKVASQASLAVSYTLPLWQLNIVEVTGHNLEARGREEVNRLLENGWVLLHIYTLKYHEENVWRERPMAILGRVKTSRQEEPVSDAALIGGPEPNAPSDDHQ